MKKDEKRIAVGAAVALALLLLYKFAKGKGAAPPSSRWIEVEGSPPVVPTGLVRFSAVQTPSYDPILFALGTQPFSRVTWQSSPPNGGLLPDWPADDRADPSRTRVEAIHTGPAFELPGARVWRQG